MKTIKCNYSDCNQNWNEDDPQCLFGESKIVFCKNHVKDETTEEGGKLISQEVAVESKDSINVPWFGSGMGLLDMELIKTKKQPFIIGIIGQPNAGKTTFLATLYMLLRNGKQIGNYQFAGSYTLLAWEQIAQFLTLNSNKKISFPPHTSSNIRVPSLLHLLLKNENGQFQDVLLTDAPGEWFSSWAKSSAGESSKGARWVDENADAFIVIADSEAFHTNIGKARLAFMQIIERMKNSCQERPISLVWTKSDIDINEAIKPAMLEGAKKHLSKIESYEIAVINRASDMDIENILQAINQLLFEKHQIKNQIPNIEIKNKDDFFFIR